MKKVTLTLVFVSAICLASFGQAAIEQTKDKAASQQVQVDQNNNTGANVVTSKGAAQMPKVNSMQAPAVLSTPVPVDPTLKTAVPVKLNPGKAAAPNPKTQLQQPAKDEANPVDQPQLLKQIKQTPNN